MVPALAIPVPRAPCLGGGWGGWCVTAPWGSQALGYPGLGLSDPKGASPLGVPGPKCPIHWGSQPLESQSEGLSPCRAHPRGSGGCPGWGGVGGVIPVPRASPALSHVTHRRVHVDDVAPVHAVHLVVLHLHRAAVGGCISGGCHPSWGGHPSHRDPTPHGDPRPGGTPLATRTLTLGGTPLAWGPAP